mmetsp:Transcript_35199/g.109600  ORF Transcript_35199/g.109600 Transcript_35199/m.109600 type:complete len:254 (+) Transcript_35199:64-825(+)
MFVTAALLAKLLRESPAASAGDGSDGQIEHYPGVGRQEKHPDHVHVPRGVLGGPRGPRRARLEVSLGNDRRQAREQRRVSSRRLQLEHRREERLPVAPPVRKHQRRVAHPLVRQRDGGDHPEGQLARQREPPSAGDWKPDRQCQERSVAEPKAVPQLHVLLRADLDRSTQQPASKALQHVRARQNVREEAEEHIDGNLQSHVASTVRGERRHEPREPHCLGRKNQQAADVGEERPWNLVGRVVPPHVLQGDEA